MMRKKMISTLLVALLLSGCATVQQKKVEAGTVTIVDLKIALAIYYNDTGRYPSDQDGLVELLHPLRPGLSPYITELPLDPWGRPYRYRLIDGFPVIDSAGPDGYFGTDDDIRE